jgi:hypothetical protein
MPKIDGFDQKNAKAFHAAVSKAISDVCKEYGVDLKKDRSLRYLNDESILKITCEFKIVNSKTKAADADKERKDWEFFASEFNLKPEWFGKSFKIPGDGTFTIIGIKPRKPKNAVSARKEEDGKTYVMPPRLVIAHMK